MSSLRKTLVESHVAAVAVAVLLFWSLNFGIRCLLGPAYRVAGLLLTAVAILDIPYYSRTLTFEDRELLVISFVYLLAAIVCGTSAWLLSRWAYGVEPIHALSRYRGVLERKNHA